MSAVRKFRIIGIGLCFIWGGISELILYLNFAALDGMNLSLGLLTPAAHFGTGSALRLEHGAGVVLWCRVAV